MRIAGLFATTAVAALSATAALAQGVPTLRGSIHTEYNRLDYEGAGGTDMWGVGGDIVAELAMGLAVQGNVAYRQTQLTGDDAKTWHYGGTVFWHAPFGKIGATVEQISTDDGSSADFTSYGAVGEFYAADTIAVLARGGWFNGTGALDGAYYGAGLRFYPMPNLAATARVDRVEFDLGGEYTDYSVVGEFLVGWFTPVSVYGGYTYSDIPGDTHVNRWTAGLKFYFGEGTLIEQDRAGAIRDPNVPVKSLGL
jgi:hypothetical protein